MKHYRPGHEPAVWPFWHDLTIVALGLVAIWLLFAGPSFADPATSGQTADRGQPVQVTPTEPPPSPIALVNSLPYQHYNDIPALNAFRIVAASRGWTPGRIASWQPFVRDVMLGESAFCWNRRRGDIVASYSRCVITRQGRHEDVGFGQVTSSWYGPTAILCLKYGVCHSSQILASPWTSMLYSIVIPIEEAGSQSWCFNSRARAYHDCWLAPDR